jgi:hypothetical protein
MSASAVNLIWDIRGDGRTWSGDEAMGRYLSSPHKLEMLDGKLLDNVEERENLLGLLLENIGANRAVEFGDPKVWRAATAKLKAEI